jgi:hypothetical protein
MSAWDKILAVIRTSEFWVALAAGVVEILNSPVPEEFKWAAWVYISFRLVSKIVKLIFPNPENPEGVWLGKD